MAAGEDAVDLVRRWFAAFNRGDLDRLVALYHEDCVNEQGGEVWTGRDEQRARLGALFASSEGAFEGGARRKVRTIARIETGWIHGEWIGRERQIESGEIVEMAGYDHFQIESGLIHRQSGVPRRVTLPSNDDHPREGPAGTPRRSRSYPAHPIVGVGAVIEQHGRVVLIRRRFEPLAGQWSLPGGTLEVGETLEAGVAREIVEETGLVVDVGPVIEVFDRILMDEEKRIRYHFVLIDYLCRPIGGTLAHGSDVDAAVFVESERLGEYGLTPKAVAIIQRGLELSKHHRWESASSSRTR